MSSPHTPSVRRVVAQHPAHRDDIGDLVTRRPLPGPGVDQLDPFLFLNHHGPQVYPANNRGLPFGPHPHRGSRRSPSFWRARWPTPTAPGTRA